MIFYATFDRESTILEQNVNEYKMAKSKYLIKS